MWASLCWGMVLAVAGSRVSGLQPNIVLILADDMGWNDVGWNNPTIWTPTLNQLAREGVLLNASYVQSVCSPSRAALMTGYYPFRMGMQHGIIKRTKPQGVPLKYKLLPQKLKKLGYATHIIGKWHLGFCSWRYTPTYRGFDTFYGFYTGSQDYYTHKSGKERALDFRLNTKVLRGQRGTYSPFLFAKRASRLIKHHNKKRPLFLYLPFQSVHTPLQVPDTYQYMYLHIQKEKRRIFAGMVTALDDAVDSIIKSLTTAGLIDNTLIVFMSDNGASVRTGGNNWPLRGGKASMWEGGSRVPSFVWGRMLKRTRYTSDELIHIVDWFPTLVAAAGGKTNRRQDGVNQWPTLRYGAPSARSEFVYGINERTGKAAIRMGKYKLLQGNPGKYNDWYLPPEKQRHRGRDKIVMDNRRFLNQTLLFNMHDDPEERFDLSAKLPAVVDKLTKRLDMYKRKLVPANNPKKMRKALPQWWHGVWSPGWC